MEINQAKNFLSQLENANTKGHYLTTNGSHQYTHIDKKSNKTLNTATIADIAEECFTALKNDGISQNQRAQLMNKLKTQVKAYNKRVHASKKWYQKVGSWFGIVSAGEKKINSIAKLAESERKTNAKAVDKFDQIHEGFVKRQETKLAGDAQQEKKIYMRIFGGINDVRNENLEGFTQSGGIKSYLDDLIRYEASISESRVGLKEEIRKMIYILENAYSISTLLEHAGSKKSIMRELQLRVTEEVQDLAERGKIGDQLLIPGGYELVKGDGHAVLYQITKTAEDKCSFTIINSGDGAKESTTVKGFGSSLINMFSQAIFDENAVREQVQDIQYENVSFQNLDLPFIQNIFDKKFNQNEKNPMQVIKNRIDTSLRQDPHVKKTNGREHSSQEIGSCTFKSISSWLKDSFTSENEYNKFKATHTEWDLDQLSSIRKGQPDAMQAEGQKILQKRKGKIK